MLIDAQEQFSNAQALTATVASTNVVDLGVDGDVGFGIGEPMDIVIQLDVAADDTTGNETYTAALQTDDDSAFGSAVQIGGTVTIAAGDVAGTRYFIPIPAAKEMDRYVRVYYTLGGTTPTVTVTSYLMPRRFVQNDQYYPNASVIDVS